MRTFLASLTMTIAFFPAVSHAAGWDGCYQLVIPGALYPKFCLQGTAEEGINGANVRLAIFGTNTEKLIYCARSTASSWDKTGFVFELDGKKEMILANATTEHGVLTGDATFGKTKLNFVQFDAVIADRMQKLANEDAKCQ